MDWIWIDKKTVLSIHCEQIAEHGGKPGIRDEGLLESALARAINRANYENADVSELAAAYGHGISRNHPFLDGNKRTAFVVTELFLLLNGFDLNADDASCLDTFLSLADGSLSQGDLSIWLNENPSPLKA